MHKPKEVVNGDDDTPTTPSGVPISERANGHVATLERPLVAQAAAPVPASLTFSWAADRERWLVGLAFAGVVLAYMWSGHYWVDLVDEGYFLDLGQRVLNGALPYRDFATYYTPGIFYLFAATFKLFGTNLLVVRYEMAIVRGLCALLLYGLSRRVAPWWLAILPPLSIVLLDTWPIEPEPHPSWPSLVACLVTMECLVQHMRTRHLRWLALAGASAGVAYLFKQNIGAFTAIGVGGYVLLRPRAIAATWVRAAQVGYVLLTALLVTAVMRQGLDPPFFGSLWLPVMLILALMLLRAMRASPEAEGSIVLDALVAGGSFSLVTAAWLAPLLLALGPGQTPLGLFVGEVDQAALASPFADFTRGGPPLLLAVIWISTGLLVRRRGHAWVGLAIAAALSAVTLALPIWQGPRDVLTQDTLLQPIVTWLDVNFGTFNLYLPSIALWAGIAGLLAFGSRATPPTLPYFVLFGGLTGLALYPRADLLHAIVAAPAALVAGTGVLAQISRRFDGWRRTALLGVLLLVPAAAIAPQVAWRVASVVRPEETPTRGDYAPLGIASAPVMVPRLSGADMRDAVQYVDAGTPPGEPLFVYPVAPLFNFLADRPNPTRFDHFLPGTLTDDDFNEVIGELRQAKPHYVLWDDIGVHVWVTDPANRPLSDYIWDCYHEVAAFHPYLVLERNQDAC